MSEKLMDYQVATSALLALATPRTLSGIQEMQKAHILAPTFLAVFPEAEYLDPEALERRFEHSLTDPGLEHAMVQARQDYVPSRTRETFELYRSQLPYQVRKSLKRLKVLGIGAGPGTILNMSPMIDSGLDLNRVVVLDKEGKPGGQWVRDPKGAGVAFNNPRMMLQGVEIDGELQGRNNAVMQQFLVEGLGSRLEKRIVRGEVKDLVHSTLGRMAQLTDMSIVGPGRGADLTFVSLGNVPLPMESRKMETNAKEFEMEFERWQRPFSREEALALDGKKVLIVGLGNSALAQIRFIEDANRLYGVEIQPVVLTHFTSLGIWDEDRPHERSDMSVDRLTRDLEAGLTTNLEKDIPESFERFRRLRFNSTFLIYPTKKSIKRVGIVGIVPSVKKLTLSKREEDYLASVYISPEHEHDMGGWYEVENIGALFYLAGYGVDAMTLANMGLIPNGSGKALVRPQDGAAKKEDGQIDPSLLVTGFASSDKDYAPSVGTMPGMMGRLPNVLWTAITLAITNNVGSCNL